MITSVHSPGCWFNHVKKPRHSALCYMYNINSLQKSAIRDYPITCKQKYLWATSSILEYCDKLAVPQHSTGNLCSYISLKNHKFQNAFAKTSVCIWEFCDWSNSVEIWLLIVIIWSQLHIWLYISYAKSIESQLDYNESNLIINSIIVNPGYWLFHSRNVFVEHEEGPCITKQNWHPSIKSVFQQHINRKYSCSIWFEI